MTVAIIDYQSGNLRSCAKAFECAVNDADLGLDVIITSDPAVVDDATHVVLPGVGAFGNCRRGLDRIKGMADALARSVEVSGKPFMGICVGMQLLATRGLEHGNYPGLDWISGVVEALVPGDPALKIPHMGWNELRISGQEHPVLAGLPKEANVYFVHSYAFHAHLENHVLATVDYGKPVVAMIGRDNIVGTQFHPEKSQKVGLKIIPNFPKWTP